MKIWTCTTCGATERLTTLPDGCSVCGGQMETQDDRRIGGFCEGATFYHNMAEIEPWAERAIEQFETEIKAGDVASTIRLWQAGCELSIEQQAIIDQVLAENRVDQITRIHDRAA